MNLLQHLTQRIDAPDTSDSERDILLTQLWNRSRQASDRERRDIGTWVASHRNITTSSALDAIIATGDEHELARLAANDSLDADTRSHVVDTRTGNNILTRALKNATPGGPASQWLRARAVERIRGQRRGHAQLADTLLEHIHTLDAATVATLARIRVATGTAPASETARRGLLDAIAQTANDGIDDLLVGRGPWQWPAAIAAAGPPCDRNQWDALVTWLTREADDHNSHAGSWERQRTSRECQHALETLAGANHPDEHWTATLANCRRHCRCSDLAAALDAVTATLTRRDTTSAATATVAELLASFSRAVQRRETSRVLDLADTLWKHPDSNDDTRLDVLGGLTTMHPRRAVTLADSSRLTARWLPSAASTLHRHDLLTSALEHVVTHRHAPTVHAAATDAVGHAATCDTASRAANVAALLHHTGPDGLAQLAWPFVVHLLNVDEHTGRLLSHWQAWRLTDEHRWTAYWELADTWTSTTADLFSTIDALS